MKWPQSPLEKPQSKIQPHISLENTFEVPALWKGEKLSDSVVPASSLLWKNKQFYLGSNDKSRCSFLQHRQKLPQALVLPQILGEGPPFPGRNRYRRPRFIALHKCCVFHKLKVVAASLSASLSNSICVAVQSFAQYFPSFCYYYICHGDLRSVISDIATAKSWRLAEDSHDSIFSNKAFLKLRCAHFFWTVL